MSDSNLERRSPTSADSWPQARPQADGEREPSEGPVIRDKRRIDPLTGALRQGTTSAPAAAPAPGATGSESAGAAAPASEAEHVQRLSQEVAERTADLQRLSAEYANYRRRVDRDREAVREAAVGNVLANLFPVLDDIDRARDHGELDGGFKAVADSLEAVVSKLGLERYGSEGEPFDPIVHEALMHEHSPDVTEPTCVRVLQPGYRIGQRILRPARVAVADPDA